ncbi:Putative SRm160/300 splicing coactivator [[Torrubiella] hemipterigena]|uniref:Putative SRm160/300 splicing coactivator n=1 Tax=[Torrubiella] hemipterigena TaxID=1531966 RepID=A0A0A1T853_9HYPO|nr:Putative SRm160/300 splicing coactivator [[Torrubiella] hemipterigena]
MSPDDGAESDYGPKTPKKTTNAFKSNHGTPTTPKRRSPTGDAVPKLAPAGGRRRSNSRRHDATLLSDFFMGKQTPERVAAERAERKRRLALQAEQAEARAEEARLEQHDMKQSAVRKLQQPSGVRDRVRAWQNSSGAAAVRGNPEYAATEPSDVAFNGEDLESVTEEDRVRIKLRKRRQSVVKMAKDIADAEAKSTADNQDSQDDDDVQSVATPRKRVVSDRNWMKQRSQKTPPRKVSPTLSRSSTGKHALPRNFLARPTPNPSASQKVKSWASKVETSSDISSHSSYRPPKSKDDDNSGTVRATPTRHRGYDDGIRVTGSNPSSVVRDDGIRVRPTEGSDISFPGQTYKPPRRRRSKSHSDSSRLTGSASVSELSAKFSEMSKPSDVSDWKPPPSTTKVRERAKSFHAAVEKARNGDGSTLSDSALGSNSDLGSNLTAKTLADIPGDIPFGHSAFSELDLTVGGTGKSRPKKPNVERKNSIKGMPNVFKKVVEEGKKIIQEVKDKEPPRPQVANKPPSIETWLNTTVDPFVDTPSGKPKTETTAPKAKDTTKSEEPKKVSQRRSSVVSNETASATQERVRATEPETTEAKSPETPKTPTPVALKRRSATKTTPTRSTGKGQFLGLLKQAFQGESAGYSPPPKTYQTKEERKFDPRHEPVYDESTILSSTVTGSELTESTLSQETRSTGRSDGSSELHSPRYRPPTTGRHELSTIMSESDHSSSLGSDLSSPATESTLTQSTVVTKESDDLTTKEPACGLKRRLTKHSDLVSVLSLPDNNGIAHDIATGRSRPSLRRKKGGASDATADELLKEFCDDEVLYMRELRTLVDGVIPVLLSHVMNGGSGIGLFDSNASVDLDSMSKSVVKMGVALEKLKVAHKKAPTADIRRLTHWAHGVIPVYSSYVSAWRLGFQDVVVNLAPAGDRVEEDSLLDALPQNDKGDLLNADGDKVAVAHLMKRPLVRIKHMTKLMRCADDLLNTQDTHDLLRDLESLQEKARRRNREEIARITDEDAANTDITRSRDIRTLDAAEVSYIDPTLQVNAKDIFSLDFVHSNGQRLECRVEIIYRDCSRQPDREGDILIREVGDGNRTYLLFPAIPMSLVSARTGDGNFDMVMMIRGTRKGKQWHELLTLYTDNEDQILDWLDLLPVSPVPPREPEPSVVDDSDFSSDRNIPVGVRYNDGRKSPLIASPTSPRTPKRSHDRRDEHEDMDKTPTQEEYNNTTSPLHDMVPAPLNLRNKKTPPPQEDDDAPPPPPAHRIPPSRSLSKHEPDLQPSPKDQLKRRGSSPLKHEYLPSDASSASASSQVNSDEDSSDDEIDSIDIPETELGVSIDSKPIQPVDSSNFGSEVSLTPSNSASQAHKHAPSMAETIPQYMASISRWSDKGMWKDISPQPCSIVVSDGLIEAYAYRPAGRGRSNSTNHGVVLDDQPLVALDLTPLVLIRQSTALDLEVRSSLQPHCILQQSISSGNFRFRCHNAPECFALYMAVHHARLNNQKFIQLENEARFRSFGERRMQEYNGDDNAAPKRRSWFGRKNSYRGSVRAPSQDGSVTPSSTPSAASFLKRITNSGNTAFNLERSSVDRHSAGGSGQNSLYSSSSHSGGRSQGMGSSNGEQRLSSMDNENIRIRLHLLVAAAKWEDLGNCTLQIRRPPPGWRQALRANHGLEKRVTVLTAPKKDGEVPRVMLDAVLGSGCFSTMGARGIVCGVWEEVKGADGVIGSVPHQGATGGNIKKWCFQLANAAEASWVLRLVHQEVLMT